MRLPNFDNNEELEGASAKSENLAEKLRTIWIEEVRRYHQRTTGRVSTYTPGPRLDGGSDAHGAIFKPVWPKLAQFVSSNSLDPVRFIKSQFFNCGGRIPLSPTMLMGPQAIKRYQRYTFNKEASRDILVARDIQIRQAKDSLEFYRRLYSNDVDAYKAMLLDDNIALSAVFRYCLAVQVGNQLLADLLLIPAANQYADDPESYDQAYEEWITEELRKESIASRR